MSARATIATMLAGAALIVAPAWSGRPPQFIWNASASVPVGLYRIAHGRSIGVADLAVIMPPEPLVGFLAERGYLPRGVPLIKRVLALGGTTVCRNGEQIAANGMPYGTARERDIQGRALPVWRGCRVIGDGEIFLMNWDAADSFDSRYFGPLPLTSIIGRAVPVWTADSGACPESETTKPIPGEP